MPDEVPDFRPRYGFAAALRKMAQEPPVEFKPGFFVNKAGSQIEVRWKNCPEHSKWLNRDVSIHMDVDTDEVVGCTIPIPAELTLREASIEDDDKSHYVQFGISFPPPKKSQRETFETGGLEGIGMVMFFLAVMMLLLKILGVRIVIP